MRRLDIPNRIPPPVEGHLRLGDLPHQPDAITVNSRYVSRGGKPGFPIMGEFHYGRDPAAELTVHELLGQLAALEELRADRDTWKARAVKAEKALRTLRKMLGGQT